MSIERRVADPSQYRRLLEVFLGFYRPLEIRLAALPGWDDHGIDFLSRRKTPWLEADLLASGLTGSQVETLPNCAGLPAVDELAGGSGCLYVLEGATLGGRQILQRRGYRVFHASSVAEAEALYRSEPVDVIVSDLGLPDGNGLDLIKKLQTVRPAPSLVLSGYGEAGTQASSLEAGVREHLTKPVEWPRLETAIQRILGRAKT